MKKLIFILLIAVVSIPAINAQFTKIGGGAAIGTGYHYNNETTFEANLHRGALAGIFVTGIYEFKLPIHIAPSFTYFIPRHNVQDIYETKVSSMMIDIDGHYVFNALDRFEFFALAGMDVQFTGIKWLESDSKDKDNVFGVNLGGGAYIKLTETLDIYGSAKYIISKYDQAMFNVGILLNVDWMKKHENDQN